MKKIKKSDIEKMLEKKEYDKISELVEFKIVDFEEFATMVLSAENMIFSDGVYHSYLQEPAILYHFLKFASNIDMEDDDIKDNLSFALNVHGAITSLLWETDDDTYSIFYRSVEDAVKHRLKMLYSYSSWDNVGDLVEELFIKINNFAEKISEEGIGVKDIIESLAKMPDKGDVVKSMLDIIKNKAKNKGDK